MPTYPNPCTSIALVIPPTPSGGSQIEQWIVDKDNARDRKEPFVYPYDLGSMYNNFVEGMYRSYSGDGIEWSVKEGCDQYTLTREQLEQKRKKRKGTILVEVEEDSDTWCRGCRHGGEGTCHGAKVWWDGPWAGDGRIDVHEGDLLTVWTMSDHWLYGEKVRRCVCFGCVTGAGGSSSCVARPAAGCPCSLVEHGPTPAPGVRVRRAGHL